ncbi:MAG: hypothetical protein IJD75_02740 [Clostridia bacterium]|nr:hypothetical protein [Clostridia bacterium]
MSQEFDLHNYDDIINLPHHTSPNRKPMSNVERGAQFSPFAALTGYDAAVIETARLTDVKRDFTEDRKAVIDMKIQIIADHIRESPYIAVTYFLPDSKKEGGAYVCISGNVWEIDEYERRIVFADKTFVPIEQIQDIESKLFGSMFE